MLDVLETVVALGVAHGVTDPEAFREDLAPLLNSRATREWARWRKALGYAEITGVELQDVYRAASRALVILERLLVGESARAMLATLGFVRLWADELARRFGEPFVSYLEERLRHYAAALDPVDRCFPSSVPTLPQAVTVARQLFAVLECSSELCGETTCWETERFGCRE